MNNQYDLIIIGGGPAGLSVALSAKQHGVNKILIIERDNLLGGILNQCIHNGFGVHYFKEELAGPEYSARFIKQINASDIQVMLSTMVLGIQENHTVLAINDRDGFISLKTRSIVLAMGCRERAKGSLLDIQGARPAGIYTAGTAQRLVNMDGYLPGKKIVMQGSGDIGLIMARRLTLEGAKVKAVLGRGYQATGLPRNVAQCIEDYNIPLLLRHSVVKIHGKNRVEAVTIAKLDEKNRPIKESFQIIECDTLLLSAGLIPENEISRNAGIMLDQRTHGAVVNEFRQTSQPGVFACGNVLHVHDVVDFVTEEALLTGEGVMRFLKGHLKSQADFTTRPDEGVSYVVPQVMSLENMDDKVQVYLRVKKAYRNAKIEVLLNDKVIATKKDVKFEPAEMVSFNIKKELLLGKESSELIFRVNHSL